MKNKIINFFGLGLVLATFLLGGYWLYQKKFAPGAKLEILPGKKVVDNGKTDTAESEKTSQTEEEIARQFMVDQIKDALAKKYNKTLSEINLEVDKIAPSHASGHASFAKENVTRWWLAFKEKGGWLLVTDGTGHVLCEEIESYYFPTDLVPECYSQISKKLIKR